MTRDFRDALRLERCWSLTTQALYEAHDEPLEDAMLQNREEVIALCEFIESHHIRSYLEVGIWTGRLISALHRLFSFDLVAACDDGWALRWGLPIHVPWRTSFYLGDSQTEGYRRWRRSLGPIDLVLLDGDHRYPGLSQDFAINSQEPHRFLALHDITGANRHTRGVKRFWDSLRTGCKLELLRPHRELGLDHSIMGLGIWSNHEAPR